MARLEQGVVTRKIFRIVVDDRVQSVKDPWEVCIEFSEVQQDGSTPVTRAGNYIP